MYEHTWNYEASQPSGPVPNIEYIELVFSESLC